MGDFIDQIQGAFNPETTTSTAAERIPFTDLTGHTKYTLGTGSQQTTLSTGTPAHNTFAYLYATDNGDTILLKRLVLPVIQKHTDETTPVIDGAITTSDDVTLRDTDNTPVTFTLTTPDANIINDKPFIPESPVHENCKLISKTTSEGIQSFSITVPIEPYNNEEHVEIHNIPIHIETRIIGHSSQDGVITGTDAEARSPSTELVTDTLPLHALDEDTQLDVFKFVLDSFDELDMQTQQSIIHMLPHVSDGVIKPHTTELAHLLYRTPSMYAREIGDVIPITPETIDEILDVITPRLSDFIESNPTPPTPILDTITTISKTIHENIDAYSQYNDFLETVAYPIVKQELNALSQSLNTHSVTVDDVQEEWVVGDGFTHRINAVLPWLLDSTVTIDEEILHGLIHLSASDEYISDSFIIDLLCNDYDDAITDTVMQNAVTTTHAVVEQVLIKHLRGEKTTTDIVSESRARTAAEIFEEITDREVIRREPPTGYASTMTSVTTKESDTAVNTTSEDSETDSNGADTTTDGDDAHEHPSDSDTTTSDAQREENGNSVTDEYVSEEPIDDKEDSNDSSDTTNESPSETSAEVTSDSTEEESNTESKGENSDVPEPTETSSNNNDTNEDEDEDENNDKDEDEDENETVGESEDVAEDSTDEVSENNDGDESDDNGEGTESDSESSNNSMSLTDF